MTPVPSHPHTIMNISQPVSSSVDRVEFTFLTKEEIHAVSVKKIENDTTFDTLLNPVRGGLYDPALGSWGDSMYVTEANPPFLPALCPDMPFLGISSHAASTHQLYDMQSWPAILSRPCRPHRPPRSSLPPDLHGPSPSPGTRSMRLLSSPALSKARDPPLRLHLPPATIWPPQGGGHG